MFFVESYLKENIKKKLIIGLFFVISASSFAQALPTIPEGCFSDKPYCHFSSFERGRDSEGDRLVTVYVNFFAQFRCLNDMRRINMVFNHL